MVIGTNCPDCGHPTVLHPMSTYATDEFPMADHCALCLLEDARRVIDEMLPAVRNSPGLP
jgi:hypothetical protein